MDKCVPYIHAGVCVHLCPFVSFAWVEVFVLTDWYNILFSVMFVCSYYDYMGSPQGWSSTY